MAVQGLILAFAVFCCVMAVCYGVDHAKLSDLKQSISVSTSPSGNVALKAGEDTITVTWELNPNFTSDASYKKVAIKLCYLKVSQVDRPWRKTEDELFKDKTCQHDVTTKDFATTGKSFSYKVLKDVPTAHYFVRAYVLDGAAKKFAYGQTDGVDLSITGITGRHASLDIASAVFSAFSVISLAFFFYLEKKKSKRAT